MTTGQKGLPAGWKWVKLQDVAFYQEGPGLRKWQWTQHGMKVVNVTNILKDGSINIDNTDKFISLDEFEATYKHFAVEEGDILLVSSGSSYGKVSRIEAHHLPLMMNTSVIRLHSLNTLVLNDIYLLSYLKTVQFKRELDELVTGAAQKNFGPSHLSKISIPLPPLEEQKRIAGILNKAEGIKKLREEADKKTQELIPAIFHEMVGSRIKKGEELPTGWKWVKLGDVCEVKGGKRLPKGTGFSVVSTGYPYIRVTDFRTGSINAQEVLHISAAIQNTISPYTISSDDVYISIAGTIGLVGRVPHELSGANLTENAAKIVINSLKVNSDFLVAYLRSSPAQAAMVMRTNVVAQPKLALTRIRTISIPLPPLEEQMQIVDQLNGAEEIKKTNAESNTKIEELQSSLLQRAFRGEL